MRILSSLKSLMIILMVFPVLAWCQVDKGFKLIEAGDLAGAWKAFRLVDPDDKAIPIVHFGQGQILANEAFPAHDLDSAYHYFYLSESTYKKLPYKDRKKLEPFTLGEIRKWQKEVQSKMVTMALAGREPDRIDQVIMAYKRLPSRNKRTLLAARNKWLWEVVVAKELPEFYRRYRLDFATYSPGLLIEMESRLFELEVGVSNWDRFAEFARQYPQHQYVRERLMDKVEELKPGRDPKAYFAFLDQHGQTPFRGLVLDSMAMAVAYRGSLVECRRYVSELDEERSSRAVWVRFYNLYKHYAFTEAAILGFMEKYPAYPFPKHLKKDLNFFVDRKFDALMSGGFTMPAAKDFLDTHPDYPGVDRLWKRYYKVFKVANASPADLERFLKENPAYPYPDSLNAERLAMIDTRADRLLANGTAGAAGYLNFLQKYPETSRKDKIWRKILARSIGENPDISQLDQFAQQYPEYPFVAELQEERVQRIAEKGEALLRTEEVTPSACLTFIKRYPESTHVGALWRKLYLLYKTKNTTVEALETFKVEYPDYPYEEEINKDIIVLKRYREKARFEQVVDIRRAFDFLEDYPESDYRKALEEPVYQMLAGSSRRLNLERFLQYFPGSRYRQQILGQLYDSATRNGTLESVTTFEEKYPDFENRTQLERDKQLAALPNLINVRFSEDRWLDFEQYIRLAAPGYRAYQVLFQYIFPDLHAENWALAAEKVQMFRDAFGEKSERYNALYAILEESARHNMELESISPLVNTPAEEYAPFISTDGQTLLFCGRFREDNLGKEDIFIARRKAGEWQEPELLRDLSSAVENEAPEALSADNNTMIVFVNGALGITEKTAEGWGEIQKLPSTINRSHWQADARITADGNAMLFASEDGDYGSRDIYVSLKEGEGTWGEAINLGPVINTEDVDRTPFLHPDMKTLYFSSVGHTGLGKMDVFMSKRLDEESWTQWSKPVNLGTAVNSVGNDWDLKVTTDGVYAYFTISNDIFLAELPQAFRPDKVATVRGRLLGIDGKPLAAKIVWQDLETGKVVQISKSDPQTGDFFVTLPNKSVFGYRVEREGYFPLSGNVDFTETIGNVELEKEMILATVEQMQEEDIRLPLNNLFFETAKYNIKPRSFPELDRLADWIEWYDLQIEILGHTDDVGEEADNELLSLNRANAVREYLVGQGTRAARIIATGFGESQPIATNQTSEGRAENRRVEIRIRK